MVTLRAGANKAIDKDFGFFNVRMLHADIVLPNNLGFVRIGRQPFDWGLGILANGGHDPHSGPWFRCRQGSLVKVLPSWSRNFHTCSRI